MSDDVTGVFVLPGFRVVSSDVLDDEWHLLVETRREPTGCPTCPTSPDSLSMVKGAVPCCADMP